jgi:RluA family pseudouridine synthase
MNLPNLYTDPDVLAVNKPEGLASVGERPDDTACLRAWVAAQLGAAVWPVHRLDKEVSGAILFARTAAAHRFLNAAFERREVVKMYHAVVHGAVAGEQGAIDRPLREFGSGRVGVAAAGKPSLTTWRVLARAAGFTLLEVTPQTGRRHQIRAHLYHLGHPVAGDLRYGDRERQRAFPRLLLHAAGLDCPLPSGGRLVLRDVPSKTFDAAWQALRNRTAGAGHPGA